MFITFEQTIQMESILPLMTWSQTIYRRRTVTTLKINHTFLLRRYGACSVAGTIVRRKSPSVFRAIPLHVNMFQLLVAMTFTILTTNSLRNWYYRIKQM